MRLWFTLPTLCALALVAGCGKSEENPMSPLDPAAAQQEVAAGDTDLAADDPPAISEVQYVVKTKVMPKLAYAEARLNKIEQQPGFVFKIAPDVTGEPDSIEVDLGDILILDSVINGVQGWLGLLVSYNFDVPSYEHVNAESLL